MDFLKYLSKYLIALCLSATLLYILLSMIAMTFFPNISLIAIWLFNILLLIFILLILPKYHRLLCTDDLTGLLNRNEFEKRLKKLLRSPSQKLHVLCYADLDHFKIINATAGYAGGDALLQEISQLLSSIMPPHTILGRIGGDEFAFIFCNTSIETAIQHVEKMINLIRLFKFNWENKMYGVGVSVGLVHFSGGDIASESVMTKAGVACYTAKNQGGNAYAVYEDIKSEASIYHQEIQIVAGIREAIEHNQFKIFAHEVQSIKETHDRVSFYEMLVRLVVGRQMIYPGEFVATAERYNLMGNIDEWVINKILIEHGEQIARLGNFSFTINLSANSLNANHFMEKLNAILVKTPISKERIGFELTETAVINNLNKAGAVLKMIQKHGAFIALDDFGSGLSSFNYLKHFPVKFVKIDGSFIRMINKSPIDKAIVGSINALAHQLGALTIAEYVEDEEILKILREMGIDYVQGYAISKEISFQAFLKGTNTGKPLS